MTMNTCRVLASGNIVTCRGKLTFPALLKARANPNNPGAEPKFSTGILIPANSNIDVLKQAAEAVAREKWGDKMPSKLRSPFLVAGEIEGAKGKTYPDEFDNWILIRCNSTYGPDIIDGAGNKVDEEREIYSGRWARLSVRAFAYENSGNRGVSFGLQNVQLLEHDTALGGSRARAEDEFEPVNVDTGSGKADAGATASSVFG